ncbi:hypothetical protein [Bacillus spizizenii]|uniref:hypothetical protein n=1 Tax=Bacillus TaxID=1386 RepID=UPI0002D451B6|nr:hypothetical protein [Bacillus spizizenii]MCY9374378.1 hypothetical protein [Bacillus sp. T17B1]
MNKSSHSFEHDCPDPLLHPFRYRFRCPECVSADEAEGFFCSPFQCQEQIPQPRFPSPTSILPHEELEELRACIEEVNELLRTVGNRPEPDQTRALQQKMQTLRNQYVKVEMICGDEIDIVTAGFVDSGLDFIILDDFEENILIPFNRIRFVQHTNDHGSHMGHVQELIDIDTCLRREIILHFGEIVSKSPYLINLFFGLKLNLFLESFIGCKIVVKLAEGDSGQIILMDGTLQCVEDDSIQINTKKDIVELHLNDICFIKV